MKRIKVYRIESKDGIGPYVSMHYREWTDRCHEGPRTPAPDLDGLPEDIPCGFYFGFESLKQLKKWFFKKEIENLAKIGFNINTYYIHKKHIMYGGKQILFERSLAIKEAA